MLKIDHIGKLHTTTYRVALHKHALWEVVYYTHGEGQVQIGDEVVPFRTGDFFILPPGVEHTDWAEAGFRDIFFTFYRENVTGECYHRFRDTEERTVYHLLVQMYDAYMREEVNRETVVNLLFELFFQYVYAWNTATRDNAYVERIRSAVIRSFTDPDFSVSAVIGGLHINENYARDLFVERVGCTPLQYLTEKRMAYARQLLRSRHLTHYSIQEIARMCGYLDPYYFSRVFRKTAGLSPRAWEKRQGAREKPSTFSGP